MNALPLTTPDGVTRTFCCGVCLRLLSYSIDRRYDEDDARHMERHREAADFCCRCHLCKQPIAEGQGAGPVTCKPCWAVVLEGKRWERFCALWKDVALAIEYGFTSMQEWRERDDKCECS